MNVLDISLRLQSKSLFLLDDMVNFTSTWKERGDQEDLVLKVGQGMLRCVSNVMSVVMSRLAVGDARTNQSANTVCLYGNDIECVCFSGDACAHRIDSLQSPPSPSSSSTSP